MAAVYQRRVEATSWCHCCRRQMAVADMGYYLESSVFGETVYCSPQCRLDVTDMIRWFNNARFDPPNWDGYLTALRQRLVTATGRALPIHASLSQIHAEVVRFSNQLGDLSRTTRLD